MLVMSFVVGLAWDRGAPSGVILAAPWLRQPEVNTGTWQDTTTTTAHMYRIKF